MCAVQFTIAFIEYFKLALNGLAEMSRESSYYLYCMIWLTIYFYITDAEVPAYYMVVPAALINVKLNDN